MKVNYENMILKHEINNLKMHQNDEKEREFFLLRQEKIQGNCHIFHYF